MGSSIAHASRPTPRHRGSLGQSAFGLFVLIATLSVLAGCGSARVALPIAIDAHAPVAAVPADAHALARPEVAVQAIAGILRNDLELPMPPDLALYVYRSRASFEEGLVDDGHVPPRRAAELAEFAIGIARRRVLLLNTAGAGHGREWLRLIAHELTHVSQIELEQGEGRAEQWLAEGMAEWVAFRVLEQLGVDTMAHRRVLACAGIRTDAALVSARLDLATLGSPRGFTVRHLREGSLPTYQLAFLMADYLIARDGFDHVVDYFASFGQGLSREAAFERAFGQKLGQFEPEVLHYLEQQVSASH